MQRTFLKLFSIALLMNLAAYGQSLGEIGAREPGKAEKAQEISRVQPRMITNKDLPADPEGWRKPRQPGHGHRCPRTWPLVILLTSIALKNKASDKNVLPGNGKGDRS